jgi:ribonuclease J
VILAVKKPRLKVIPLGGLQEIGKNMTIFECGNEIIVVDCGVAFPQDDMLGIDLVIPDFDYLKKEQK